MNELEKQNQTDEQKEYMEAAKSALVFAILFIILIVSLWGYVYLILLERGMTQ